MSTRVACAAVQGHSALQKWGPPNEAEVPGVWFFPGGTYILPAASGQQAADLDQTILGKTPLEVLVVRWLTSSFEDRESALISRRYGVPGFFILLLYWNWCSYRLEMKFLILRGNTVQSLPLYVSVLQIILGSSKTNRAIRHSIITGKNEEKISRDLFCTLSC